VEILTWNLFHGRAQPPAGRHLLEDFAAAIARWEWDVALLQEVPPWWPVPLARASEASMRMALTSRNWLRPLTDPLARALPDVLKSWGGGCNAILVRGAPIAEHRTLTLRWRPERRVAHGVRLGDGPWIANLHAHNGAAEARRDVARAGAALLDWAGQGPAILGGDFNLRDPDVPGLTRLGGHNVDKVLGRGFTRVGQRLGDRGTLSDHEAVLVQCAVDPAAARLPRPG
jgi:endonuclease/exonuclease/phosphatase family metal-dependent hydrolase